MKYLEEVTAPYFKKQRSIEGLDESQKALVIMDVITGQMTPEILDSYQAYNVCVCVINVLRSITKYYQPPDLTVNRETKRFLESKFVDWYSYQVSNRLSEGKPLESVQVPLKFCIIKSINASWLVEFYNYMISGDRQKYINSGWRAFGITDTVKMGKANLPPIDIFNDVEPLLRSTQQTQESDSVIAIPEEQNGLRCSSDDEYDESSDDDSEWDYAGRSAFDAFIVDE